MKFLRWFLAKFRKPQWYDRPQTIKVSEEEWNKITDALANPQPPTEALKKLMRRK